MNFQVKLPDYIPKKLAIAMVSFLVFCVMGLPFWIFVLDEVKEFRKPIAAAQPDSLKNLPVTYYKITKDLIDWLPEEEPGTRRMRQEPSKDPDS